LGWEQAIRTLKRGKESVVKVIVKDFNTYLDLLRDEIYEKRKVCCRT
jgi:DNA-directed RNA polymerase subunit L